MTLSSFGKKLLLGVISSSGEEDTAETLSERFSLRICISLSDLAGVVRVSKWMLLKKIALVVSNQEPQSDL